MMEGELVRAMVLVVDKNSGRKYKGLNSKKSSSRRSAEGAERRDSFICCGAFGAAGAEGVKNNVHSTRTRIQQKLARESRSPRQTAPALQHTAHGQNLSPGLCPIFLSTKTPICFEESFTFLAETPDKWVPDVRWSSRAAIRDPSDSANPVVSTKRFVILTFGAQTEV